jgi:type IV secretion system protein VirD4
MLPKGTVLLEVGKMLYDAGYEIKVINKINFRKSMHFNPFVYIHSEKDILKLVNTLIANTKGEGDKSGEDFWLKAEKLLYQAYIGYIYYECVFEEQNFSTLLEMINAMEVREDDEEFKNAVDMLFEELEERDPDHFAVRQYAKYKLAAGVINYKRFLIQSYERQPMAA